ncbi:hypothetical protein [Levilactobacillus bambusae]|uniref:Uncharacterized protein n=1 Tax=Levilactobacillus bambusae TaxID=2024736 RepID=A0A2V1N5T0_9LACO|nr:hypothetical protein [Levilactobacillus bambusae]PWG01095.1 hypothetical protein DCM90_02665 [Levilactobacillus bambusae]
MLQIKVVGDIRQGPFQPSLTGNPIVDEGLLRHFCQKLAKQVSVPVVVSHDFDPTASSPDIFIIDDQILNQWTENHPHQLTVIPIPHNELLHGVVQPTINRLLDGTELSSPTN